jgi:hypothetical protein
MRWFAWTLVAVAVIGPSTARADAAEPSCETVTTVKCTGSAAALALPGAQPGAPVNIAPPVGAPPEAPPAWNQHAAAPDDCCGPAASNLPPMHLPHGWALGRDERGMLYAEVQKHSPRASVWVPGLVLWLASYVGTAAAGGVYDGNPVASVPLVGGMASAIIYGLGDDGPSFGKIAGYTLGSMLQVGGMVTFIVGMSANHKLERLPVKFGAGGLYGTF